MAATTLTAADLLLIIVPLLATMVGLFLHNNRLIHNTGREIRQEVKGELAEIRQEFNKRMDDLSREGKEERAEIRLEGKEERAEIRGELNKRMDDLSREGKEERAEIRAGLGRLGADVARLGADVALIKGVILGADAIRQSVTEQDVA